MFNHIIFDLDGTLVDSQEGITKSVQYALAKIGIQEPDLSQLVKFIGPPLAGSFEKYYLLDKATAWRCVEYYREYYITKGMYQLKLYDGIESLLLQLKQQGKHLYIATAKPTHFSEQIVKNLNLTIYFDMVIGSNLDGTRVEKQESIATILSQTSSANPSDWLMIGDKEHDIRGAKLNGIACFGVLYGYGTTEEIQAAEPDLIVSSVNELKLMLLK